MNARSYQPSRERDTPLANARPGPHDGAMSAAGPAAMAWSRSDLRARWKALAVLGMLAGLTMGLAVAALDGARRTSSAVDRLADRTRASDAIVFASQVGLDHPDWSKLAARPEVEELGRWALLFGEVSGQGLEPFFGPLFGSVDGVWTGGIDRPIVMAGRMFDPAAPDEMVVDENAAAEVPLGSVVHFRPMTPVDADAPYGTATGAPVQFRVVGIVRNLQQFVFNSDGLTLVSPGYLARYGESTVTYENANVRLDPDVDMDQFRVHANEDVAPGVPVLDQRQTARRVRTTTDVERTMLVVLGGVLLAAGAALVGQAVARSAGSIGGDARTLGAMGMTRRQLLAAATVPHLVSVAVAVAAMIGAATLASRWFPVGFAARVDPDRGIRVATDLAAVGAVVLAMALIGTVLSAAWRATAPARPGAPLRRQPRLAFGRIRPLSVGLGVDMALQARAASRRTGTGAALLGASAAVAGIVGMITLNRGLDDALAHPERAGVVWDAAVLPPADASGRGEASPDLVADVTGHPDVVAAAVIGREVTEIAGRGSSGAGVPTFAVFETPDKPSIDFSVVRGRLPRARREVALGPATADALDLDIGDLARLADGTECEVVGFALFPSDVHAAFDEGALLVPAQFEALEAVVLPDAVAGAAGSEEPNVGLRLIAVRFAPGEVGARMEALSDRVGERAESIEPVEVPDELSNLRNIRSLPLLLAVFLALLGVSAVGHGIITSVRRRARDLAILRALGFTRRGVSAIMGALATTIAVVGVIAGVPIGMVAGRAGWQQITDRVPLAFVTPYATAALIVVIPIAVVVANALAAGPARQETRTAPALVLRSE